MAREHPADEREWTQPARVRIGVVFRRVWPSLVIAAVVWSGWIAVARRRARRAG